MAFDLVFLLSSGEVGSDILRGTHISQGLIDLGFSVRCIATEKDFGKIDGIEKTLNEIRNSIVICVRTSLVVWKNTRDLISEMKRNGNVIVFDVVDSWPTRDQGLIKAVETGFRACDALIVTNQHMRECFIRKGFKGVISIIPHHWDPRLKTQDCSAGQDISFGYVGTVKCIEDNLLHYKELIDKYGVTLFDTECGEDVTEKFKRDDFDWSHNKDNMGINEPGFNTELSIRTGFPSKFKSNAKISTAAALGHLIVCSKDASFTWFLDSSKYPYYIDGDECSFDDVERTLKFLKETHNQEEGQIARAMLEELKDRTSLKNVVRCFYSRLLYTWKNRDSKVCMLIPYAGDALSGGHSTALSMLVSLYDKGYACTVIVTHVPKMEGFSEKAVAIIRQYARLQNPNIHVTVLEDALGSTYDYAVATAWMTVEHSFEFVGNKAENVVYFVQDYEPSFEHDAKKFQKAADTYNSGAQMIPLGHWVWEKILTNHPHGKIVSPINFGVNVSVYSPPSTSDMVRKFDVCVAYYKDKPTRLPNVTRDIISRLVKKGLRVVCFPDGNDIDGVKCTGKLTQNKLADLYRSSRIGICASGTNTSRIPLEMAACGCKVVGIGDSKDLPEMFGIYMVDSSSNHKQMEENGEHVLVKTKDMEPMVLKVVNQTLELIKQPIDVVACKQIYQSSSWECHQFSAIFSLSMTDWSTVSTENIVFHLYLECLRRLPDTGNNVYLDIIEKEKTTECVLKCAHSILLSTECVRQWVG